MICNKDCFNCPYPDCINDEMDHEDYVEAAERDRDLRMTPEEKKVAAAQKAYYEANREKVAGEQQILKRCRRAAGISQQAFADAIGVSQSVICRWEIGEVPVDVPEVLGKLAGLARCSVGALLEMAEQDRRSA